MSQFRQLIPSSFISSRSEDFEFMICWLSVSGGVRQWFFSSTENSIDEEVTFSKIETSTSIRSSPNSITKTYTVETSGLDYRNFELVKSLLKTDRAYLMSKDLELTEIAIEDASISRNNQIKEYSVQLEFTTKEEDKLNL